MGALHPCSKLIRVAPFLLPPLLSGLSLTGLPKKALDAAVGTRAPKQLAEYSKAEDAVVGIPEVTRPSLSQGGCYPQSAKKQPTAGEPWVSALSTSKILAPIPASETNLGFEDVIGTVDGTSKPKALPLSVSQAVRNELAKVATTTTQPGQLQPSLGGYVYGLPVTANPAPLAQKPTMMCPRVPGNEMTAQRTSSQIEFNWGNLHEDPKEKPVRGVPRRVQDNPLYLVVFLLT